MAPDNRTDQLLTDFKSTRGFNALQQLRTISVLLVLAYHMQDPLWGPLRGFLGVTVFFVISGFLITTLLLREEARTGSVSLKRFYIRRVFRILPIYYLTFLLFAVLILGLGLGSEVDRFEDALPYFVSYQNEFAPAAPFGHSWSLAIEEKYYLAWPLLAFAIVPLRRYRPAVASGLLGVAVLSELVGLSYAPIYAPILAGCILAILMNDASGFRRVQPLTRPGI